MKELNRVGFALVLALLILISIQLYFLIIPVNYDHFSIKGDKDTCTENCFPFFKVKNVYTGTNSEVESDYIYGGASSPQICEDVIETFRCEELDITKLNEYKTVVRMIINKEKSFPNFQYLNRFVESPSNKKIYFLYRVLNENNNETKTVYDDPLAILSFNIDTRTVEFESQLNVTGINVKNMYISPKGNNILIEEAFNPYYLPKTIAFGIIIFNLKNKMTKDFIVVEKGGWLKFIHWIDDNHFFYSQNYYNNEEKTIFKIGTI